MEAAAAAEAVVAVTMHVQAVRADARENAMAAAHAAVYVIPAAEEDAAVDARAAAWESAPLIAVAHAREAAMARQ